MVVWKLNRLGHSLRGLIDLAAEFKSREVEFNSLQDGINTATLHWSCCARNEVLVIRQRFYSVNFKGFCSTVLSSVLVLNNASIFWFTTAIKLMLFVKRIC
jgi:hypothetical protein